MKPVDAARMRQIDTEAQKIFGIPELILMENAGRETAAVIQERFGQRKGTIAFFCGKGNNGGDGLVAARHLWIQDFPIIMILMGDPVSLKGSAAVNFEILRRMHGPIHIVMQTENFTTTLSGSKRWVLAVDALLGIGLEGNVRDPYRSAIEQINRLSCPIVSVDIPSGLCATTGKTLGCCVKARHTVTFGLPKKGFYLAEGPRMVGEVIVRNIGYPRELLS